MSQLHEIVAELETLYPGRKFTPDGHLVGSLGEVSAATLFDLRLLPASTAGHDAVDAEGRPVEIKATYGTRGTSVRQTSFGVAERLIVLRLAKDPELTHEVVYNGPYSLVHAQLGRFQSNGAAALSLSRLRLLDATLSEKERVPRRAGR
ncbi:DUF6998 domain-containing protein [Corynebacterium sp. A21]|uniref:DUF6998 domain-containing protein n=1 Tax=Corynebacterium sp. A21 TaxID=3457318 RepID=UPI003FD3531E